MFQTSLSVASTFFMIPDLWKQTAIPNSSVQNRTIYQKSFFVAVCKSGTCILALLFNIIKSIRSYLRILLDRLLGNSIVVLIIIGTTISIGGSLLSVSHKIKYSCVINHQNWRAGFMSDRQC